MSYGNIIKARDILEETVLDKIGKHHLAGTTENMPDDLKAILSRWDEVLECITNGRLVHFKGNDVKTPYNHRDLVTHLKTKFEISASQAAKDIGDAKIYHLLCEPREHKEFARGWMIEQMERLMFLAESKNDLKSVAAFAKILVSIRGLDRHDAEAPDYTKIQPPELLIVSDPREAIPNLPEVKNPDDIVKKYLKQRKADWIESVIEDAEEVTDGED